MITIWNGSINLPWWVGKKVECKHCGRVVQLEIGDEHHKSCVSANNDFFEVQCAQCGKTNAVHNKP
jgi:ribosomal protein S27E